MDAALFSIETTHAANRGDLEAVREGLVQYNRSQVPLLGHSEFAVLAREGEGRVVGGVLAETMHGWLHVSTVWVDDRVRGNGLGSLLLVAAENEARRVGTHSAYLDTFSFQARPFYERHGYEVFGTLEDFPVGHQRYFLKKRLVQKDVVAAETQSS